MRYRKKNWTFFFIEGDAGEPFYRPDHLNWVRAVRNAPKSVPGARVCRKQWAAGVGCRNWLAGIP